MLFKIIYWFWTKKQQQQRKHDHGTMKMKQGESKIDKSLPKLNHFFFSFGHTQWP